MILLGIWKKVLPLIKIAGEKGHADLSSLKSDCKFWQEIGIFTSGGFLTEEGKKIFESIFILCDGKEVEIFGQLLLDFAPTIIIQEYFEKMDKVSVEQIISVLKAKNCLISDSASIVNFLEFLNYSGVVAYHRKTKKIKILISRSSSQANDHIFIEPKKPFSNILGIKSVIRECKGFIYWFDKHFQKEALEWLLEATGEVKEIRILSLNLGEKNLCKQARKDFERFKTEMNNKGIRVSWFVIEVDKIKDTHDRWIIDGCGKARNIPNVNAISSGQKSEITRTQNYKEILGFFEEKWVKSASFN